MADFDLAVIGGGINGAGIARDAAGRGLRVLLVEKGDLGSGTSSASTKLIHGGLRYLEHGWFRLVRRALTEREILLRAAPHLVRPMRFVLPVTEGLRPAPLLRLGLLAYDLMGSRRILPRSHAVDLSGEAVLKPQYGYGFAYSDCRVDDARLVVLNAVDAAERGAAVRTRTRATRADRERRVWRLVLETETASEQVTARALVNASGPWLRKVAETVLRQPLRQPLRLLKGSHIVIRRRFDPGHAYVFQLVDRRIIFAIPFEGCFTLIGTTDQEFAGDPDEVVPIGPEIDYLCRGANAYLREEIAPEDVVWAFAGVRALSGDAALGAEDVSRDYVLDLHAPADQAPLLTVYGGKITTYRRLAEAALAQLGTTLPVGAPWTRDEALPGGDFPWDGFDDVVRRLRSRYGFLTEGHVRRLVAAYGTRAENILRGAASFADLGECFGGDLTAAEVRYLMRCEWAETADDVLWRRSKLGLHLTADERAALARHMAGANQRRTAAE
jgi:glycerol-3-phosphate dehydrogenase